MKRLYWIFISFLTVTLLLYGSWRTLEPWVIQQGITIVQKILLEEAEISLETEKAEIHLLPPSLNLKNTKIGFKKEKLKYIEKVEIKEAKAQIDFLQLIGGRISLSLIHLTKPLVVINLNNYKSDDKPLEKIDLMPLFELTKVLPITRVLLSEIELSVKEDKMGSLLIQNGQIFAKLDRQAIQINNLFPEVSLQLQNKSVTLSWNSEVTLSPNELLIEKVQIKSTKTELLGSGKSTQLQYLHKKPNLTFNLEGHIGLEEFSFLSEALSKDLKSSGKLSLVLKGKIPVWTNPNLESEIKLENTKLGPYRIDSLNTQVSFVKDQLKIQKLTAHNDIAQIWMIDSNLSLNSPYEFKGQISTEKFDIQNLMQNLNLKTVPVDLMIQGALQCRGRLNQFLMSCTGELNGANLSVRTAMPKVANEIVGIRDFTTKGSLEVDTEKVTYNTQLKVGSSVGSSEGRIEYANGFNIKYATNALDLKDVANLANLKLEGKAQIQGSTSGDSSFGLIDMEIATQDFWFEDFLLESIKGKLNYKEGHILIAANEAQIGESRYNGNLDVNLNDSTLKAALKFPILEAQDVVKAINRKVESPIILSGRGEGKIEVEGPFSLGALTYDLTANFKRGKIATENYDESQIQLIAKNGNVRLGQNFIRKNKGRIDVTGWATPSGDINLYVDGRRFQLDEVDLINPLHQYLTGELNFRMKLTDHILNPSMSLTGGITDSILADIEMPNSDFSFDMNESFISGALQLFGNKIRSEFNIPRSPDQTSKIQFETVNWDYATLLALLGNGAIKNEYKSNLTMHLNLESKSGGIFQSSGEAVIERLSLVRGDLSLANPKPITIKFNSGFATLNQFNLEGPDAKVQLSGENFTAEKVNVHAQGNLDLKILQVFTPFFDDFGGAAAADLRFTGSLFNPEIFGRIKSKNFFFKITGFPHPFEQVSADIELSQRKIMLQSLRGILAGGQLAADGSVDIIGSRNFKVNLKARATDVTLNMPDKMRTNGSAEVSITGDWFPYLLSGTYKISQGLIEKDFTEEDKGIQTVKHSIYLPQELTQKSFEPISLDIQIIMDNQVIISNPQVKGPITGQLQVKGTPSSPQLSGQIKVIPGAKLLFRDKLFDIQSGTVKFNDPTELNPELYVSARSRVETYDISLLIQGKAKEPLLLLTSQPPLENQDIISLLALGVTSKKLDSEISSEQQAAQTSYQITSAILSANPLGKEIKESTGWDLKLSSSFDDTKNVAIPKATLSKDLNKRLNVSATSSLGQFQIYDVRLQYLINENISAVGTYEKTEQQENSTNSSLREDSKSVFGLDLEYKMEFR